MADIYAFDMNWSIPAPLKEKLNGVFADWMMEHGEGSSGGGGGGAPDLTPKFYGAKGDGVTDDTAAFQNALNAAAGKVLTIPAGRYILTGNLAVPRDTTLQGAGSRAVTLDWSTRDTWNNTPNTAFLEWEAGTVTSVTPLAEDVAVGAGYVTVTDSAEFVVGDTIRLTSAEVVFGEAVRAEYHRIVQIEGPKLYLSTSTFDTYTAAQSGEVEKLDLVTGALSGVTIVGKGLNPDSVTDDNTDVRRGDNGVLFSFARDVSMRDVRFDKVENICSRFNSVLGLDISDCSFTFDTARIRLQYGVALNGSTQMVSIRGCHSWSDRHMVTTSTSQALSELWRAARGIPRVISITGNTAHGSWQNPIDTHKGGEYITITGNALTTEAVGVKCRGTHMVVSDNVISGKTESPYSTSLTGVRVLERGRDVRVQGNMIRGFNSGVLFEMLPADTRALVVAENTITRCTRGVAVVNANATPVNDLRITGNHITNLQATGYPIFLDATIQDLVITDNTLVAGIEGIRGTHGSSYTITRALIQGNTCRGASNLAMYLRNLTEVLVQGNTAAVGGSAPIRIVGNNTRVTVQMNMAYISDLSTTRTTVNVGFNAPQSMPSAVPVTAEGVHAALVALGLIST